jgi:plasmid stabilization system protein ParE
MAYLVSITPRAERDLMGIYVRTNWEGSAAAEKWYWGLRDAVQSLENRPNRCPIIPEHRKRKSGEPRGGRIRHLLYGRQPHAYRVIYRVREKQRRVEVLHIRHGARQKVKASRLS